MLTNKTSQDVRDNVATDLNANVKAASNGKVLSREAAILFDKSIVAKPLNTPEVCSVHVKNLEYQYRWVNYTAKNGLMYMKRRAQGFTDATGEDVDVLGGDVVIDGGKITAFDLVLMKIPHERYDAAIKANALEAMRLTQARGIYLDGGSSDVFDDSKAKRVSVAQEPFRKGGMAEAFIPDNADALVDDSIRSGRVEETRRAVDEIRAAGRAAKEK